MITAASSKVTSLYKYQQYDAGHLKQLVQNNTIYFSNPSDFNDPWDCQPYFSTDLLNQEYNIKTLLDTYQKRSTNRRVDVEKCISDLESDPKKYADFIIDFSAETTRDLGDRYRINCLTTKNDNILMWSHYAAEHTGICLEFDTQNSIFRSALKIEYLANYPTLQLHDNSADNILKRFTTKSADWSYEDEYRLVAIESTKFDRPLPNVLTVTNNLLNIPDGCLRSIIVGCRMSEDNKNSIRYLIKESGKKMFFREAVRLPNKYGLKIR